MLTFGELNKWVEDNDIPDDAKLVVPDPDRKITVPWPVKVSYSKKWNRILVENLYDL